ncbi:MAG: hypothetical protein Fur0043_09660 [Anaerolineales bacterium]
MLSICAGLGNPAYVDEYDSAKFARIHKFSRIYAKKLAQIRGFERLCIAVAGNYAKFA